MEKAVDQVFMPSILEGFLRAYNLDKEYKLLGDFENYVYQVKQGDRSAILRITHSSHRSEDEIQGELTWLSYLHQHAANVPEVFESIHKNLVEKQIAEDNTVFFACLFSKVEGEQVRANDTKFNEELFRSWGKEIGKLHRLTTEYKPAIETRKQWYEDDLFEIEKYVPKEAAVIEQTRQIIRKLKGLPKQDFALIHNDVHNGNFFYDGREIHIFDFDDACYFWLVSDIAIPLYYSCYALFPEDSNEEEKVRFANQFLEAFMKGYTQEMVPPKDWEKQLSLFLQVRDITLYAALNKKIAPEDRNENLQRRMNQIKQRIEQRTPIVSIN
jgi:amicoumacin kinase